MSRSTFGSQTRAADGLIVTFELPDGSVRVEHFAQLVRTRGGYARIVVKEGLPAVEQAAARADELGASILTLSNPETILTDLRGSRASHNVRRDEQHERTDVEFPERGMLGRIGRADLFRAPSERRLAETSQRPSKRRRRR